MQWILPNLSLSVWGFRSRRGPNIAISHWLEPSPLQQCYALTCYIVMVANTPVMHSKQCCSGHASEYRYLLGWCRLLGRVIAGCSRERKQTFVGIIEDGDKCLWGRLGMAINFCPRAAFYFQKLDRVTIRRRICWKITSRWRSNYKVKVAHWQPFRANCVCGIIFLRRNIVY